MQLKDIRANPLADGSIMLQAIVRGDNQAIQRVLDDFGINPQGWEINVGKPPKPKSKDANSYMWVLCDKIAQKLKSTKEEVYRHAIREVGMFDDVPIKNDQVDSKVALWNNIGVGWFAEVMRDSKHQGYTVVREYFGSRAYDNANMCRLVDYVVEAAKEQGIDVRTPEEIDRMKSLWGKEEKNG